MATGNLLDTPALSLAAIDARSSSENFPVASLLAPPSARPHLRAVYGFARLVDNLGDEAEGDRVALLDELERELDRCYDGRPRTAVMQRLQETIGARGLEREPFWRLIEANRIDQRRARYDSWDEVRWYCTFSAEPVGRLVLGIYGRAGDAELVALSDDVCTGLQLVNFLQDPPRDLALGRVYLPLEDLRHFGVLVGELAGPRSDRLTSLCRFEAARAAALLERGFPLARTLGGRAGRSVALFARGGLVALGALERSGWDVFSARPAPGRLMFALLTARELVVSPGSSVMHCRARTKQGGDAGSARIGLEIRARPRTPAGAGSQPARRAVLPGATTSALMTLDDAYAECVRITRREAKNFAWGIMLLPRPKRLALAALYAYARRVDDIADGGGDAEARRADLEAVDLAVAGLADAPRDDAVLVALADTVRRYPVPEAVLHALIEGALWDVDRGRYQSWEELREYCRRVAGAVGVACTAVYGPTDAEHARPLAETLGLALQQINIMRDVPEDWSLGRIYLPGDEMERFGVSEDDIAEGRMGPGWRALMAHQSSRARALLGEGFGLLPLLDGRSALCVRTLAGIYAGLLDEIERREYDVFTTRPSLSTLGKLRVIGSGLLREAA